MSSPIAFRGFDPDEYRTLSDGELIREGKKMRWLSADGKIVSTMPCAFEEQLKILPGRVADAAPAYYGFVKIEWA